MYYDSIVLYRILLIWFNIFKSFRNKILRILASPLENTGCGMHKYQKPTKVQSCFGRLYKRFKNNNNQNNNKESINKTKKQQQQR